jgi:hypothetical protein
LWPIAVMIDNHTAARPQSGLQSASIVYESLAEGGIPRFMAVYPGTSVSTGVIGPVRSTRPYFVRYAAEYSAAMAHAGGSPDGLALVKKYKLLGLWALKGVYAKFYYRAYGGGVHGLYTSGKNLAAALSQAKFTKLKPSYRPWKYVAQPTLKKRATGKHGAIIDLGYGYNYKIQYTYDRARNVYLRFTGGRMHIDRQTKKQIAIKNIVILNVPKEKVLDNKGRLDLKIVGRDSGYLLQNGKVTPITWIKKTERARTVFYDKKGKEITLNQGNTWITVVPRGHKYSVY